MASELVPGDFSLVENNASFADFRKVHKRGLSPSANYLFTKKKKKKTLIRAKNSSAEYYKLVCGRA